MTTITTGDGVGLEIVVSGRSDGPDLMFCNSLGTGLCWQERPEL